MMAAATTGANDESTFGWGENWRKLEGTEFRGTYVNFAKFPHQKTK
jgi:hypothetical protein